MVKMDTLSAWLRGQIDWEESSGEWRLRAQFYNASGGNLGYNDLCYDSNLNTLTGNKKTGGQITCPPVFTQLLF
jgi:hypothetical protein